MAHYEVKGDKVIADIKKLTATELVAVKNYKALGYEIIEKVEEKKAPKENFKAENVQKWLEKNATKDQIATYWELYNAPYIDKETGNPVVLKNDSKTTGQKKGEIRKVGHVATLSWLSKTFDEFKTEKKAK